MIGPLSHRPPSSLSDLTPKLACNGVRIKMLKTTPSFLRNLGWPEVDLEVPGFGSKRGSLPEPGGEVLVRIAGQPSIGLKNERL